MSGISKTASVKTHPVICGVIAAGNMPGSPNTNPSGEEKALLHHKLPFDTFSLLYLQF
jgi:hypothetical protein